jgi:hypothetical protein
MKTGNQIELTPRAASRRKLTTRTAVASLALATATIPAIAGDRSATVTKEDPNTIRPFHVNVPKGDGAEPLTSVLALPRRNARQPKDLYVHPSQKIGHEEIQL